MGFIGRKRELARLGRELAAPRQSTVLVYGRRRVGKSELIKRALEGAEGDVLYYECKQTTEADNVASLSALASERLGLPPLAFDGVEPLLRFLFGRASGDSGRPCALVLDEYPYLRSAVKGLDSVLQSVIDSFAGSSRMTLVLCGSYVDVMKSLLEHANPLYGRVDLAIDLQPMDYYESSLFYPGFSPEDKVRLYSVFGGVPYYNRLVDASASVRENVVGLVTETGERLEGEVSSYLRSEISKMENANEVFGALAQGYSRYRDILDQSHVSSGPAMVDVLDKLIGMGLVRKESPINDPGNRRKSGYRISDPLALFYYRYAFRYASQRTFLDPDAFYDRYVERDFEERHVPLMFEEVCRQYLVRMNRARRLPELFDEIGKYWYDDPATRTNGEFDVVTRDPEGYAFYEAKFRGSPVTAAMIEEEISQVERCGLRCYRYGFFSRSGFDLGAAGRRPDVALFDLPELYE